MSPLRAKKIQKRSVSNLYAVPTLCAARKAAGKEQKVERISTRNMIGVHFCEESPERADNGEKELQVLLKLRLKELRITGWCRW